MDIELALERMVLGLLSLSAALMAACLFWV
jgi:hypothetical protein